MDLHLHRVHFLVFILYCNFICVLSVVIIKTDDDDDDDYRQRLEFLNLSILAFRRNRGDMIEVYKILTGKYDPTLPSILHRNIQAPPGATH